MKLRKLTNLHKCYFRSFGFRDHAQWLEIAGRKAVRNTFPSIKYHTEYKIILLEIIPFPPGGVRTHAKHDKALLCPMTSRFLGNGKESELVRDKPDRKSAKVTIFPHHQFSLFVETSSNWCICCVCRVGCSSGELQGILCNTDLRDYVWWN